MDDDGPFLLEALLAVLPYLIAATAGWINRRIASRRVGADAPSWNIMRQG